MRTKNQFRILLVVIVLMVNLLPFVNVRPVMAVITTTNLTVTGGGTYGGGPVGGGNPQPVYTSYNVSNLTSVGNITSAKQYTSLIWETSYYATALPICVISGTVYNAPSGYFFAPADPATTTGIYDWLVDPSTNVAWSEVGLNNAEFGFKVGWSGASSVWIYGTSTDIQVTYYPATFPDVTTQAVTSIAYSTNHTATLNGNITSINAANPSIRGFVYDTSTHGNPAPLSPAASAYSANSTESGNFTTGTYTRNLQSLTKGQIYYVRACAYNSYGWAYGDEVSFTALTDPSIVTVAASSISATTARLNASVTNSGGQAADAKFGYGVISGNMQTYTTNTTLAENLYGTGTTPYADISGLTANTTYYYRAWINNDVSSANGTELSFNTSATIGQPTSLSANPSSTSVSLTWVNGLGSSDTLIVYKTSSYPLSKTDGTTGYNGTATSYTISGLTTGTTYYFMAWGKSGTTYSSGNASVLSTTIAGSSQSDIFTGYGTPALWFQAPDYTKMSAFPLYGLFNWWSDSFAMPRSTFWFLLAMMFAIACGVIIYAMSHNIIMGSVAVTMVVVVVSIMGLMSYWMLLPFIIATVTIIMVGQRA